MRVFQAEEVEIEKEEEGENENDKKETEVITKPTTDLSIIMERIDRLETSMADLIGTIVSDC